MNIIIAGVGGQGSILAAKIFGSLYLARGFDVKVNEVHGMSQRGGSVVTMVRAGDKVYSPLVMPGGADLLIGLEVTETARCLRWLSPNGKTVVSSWRIPIQGDESGPCILLGEPQIDAHGLAAKAGSPRCENTVLLGAASKLLDFTEEEWEQAIRENVKPSTLDVNMKAFKAGRDL
ncbi:MAG: indolepyruvate oxidoreductase subunit beta [Oscillospiraceae bacterium]|jgi:indolepyruvate ferredoxin oxidoreductase beta subunit|nr:indolepyruvate oxidoreductase subunit beta [Oscillospiraceae bacterium]